MAVLPSVCVLLLSAASLALEPGIVPFISNTTTASDNVPDKVAEKPEDLTTISSNQTTVPQKPAEVELPKIAANQEKGTKGLNGTLLITEPDAIKKDLGSRCKSDVDCSGLNNTFCSNFGVCECIGGFIPSKHSLDKCVKVPSGLGDSCQEEAQCGHAVAASECRDGTCACPPNFVFDGAVRCWERQSLGGACNITLQCDNVASAICSQGVCNCDGSLIPSPENKCLQPAGKDYLASCEEDIQCSYSYGDEARCSNGQCRCTNDYHYNGTTCVADKKLGEPCSTDIDCAVDEINDTKGKRMCLLYECACSTGFNVLPGEEICTKSAADELAVSLVWVLCIAVARHFVT